MDSAILIKEAKDGSKGAQKCIYDTWSGKMMMVCRRYAKSSEDAEEIMLDGFFKFFKTISSFQYQSDAALHMWLKKIMINECLMFLRKKNAFNMVSESAAAEIPLEEDVFNLLGAAEIFNLIVQLPIGYRTVFNLHVVEGLEHQEIAGILGISEGTSKSQLSRAKTLLQKMLVSHGTTYVKRKIQ